MQGSLEQNPAFSTSGRKLTTQTFRGSPGEVDWMGLRLVMASAISVLVIAESTGAYELCPLWILLRLPTVTSASW